MLISNFAVYGVSMGVFVVIQFIFHIPEGWLIVHTTEGLANVGLQAPYEDISSFGSIAVAVFIFAAANVRASTLFGLVINIFGCSCLLIMTMASWSRGAWLSGLVFLLLIAMIKLPRSFAITLMLLGFGAVVAINIDANRSFWTNHPYPARLLGLVRIEKITNKDAGRLNLYRKAGRMLSEHPYIGHGIGSFYLKSVEYADPNDSRGRIPDFAHNVFIQIAVEEGIPVAALYASLIIWTFSRGFGALRVERHKSSSYSTTQMLILGITLSLGAYLQTQMTANSLNVYLTNQFFFWFLVSAILIMSIEDFEPSADTLIAH